MHGTKPSPVDTVLLWQLERDQRNQVKQESFQAISSSAVSCAAKQADSASMNLEEDHPIHECCPFYPWEENRLRDQSFCVFSVSA